jgi:segregation and condensation protein A
LERQNSKEEIIVSFLVILELIKVGKIKVKQDKINDDITITTVAKAG